MSSRAEGLDRAPARVRRPDALATVLLAAVVVASAFVAGGGGTLADTTAVALGLTALGGVAAAAAVVLAPPRRPLHGGAALLCFALLTACTAASIAWSIAPADSWNAANLTVGYLATFAGAIALVRIAPARWTALLSAVALAAVVVSAWSLVVKVFPTIAPFEIYARLRAPFDYWNAVGLMAALGLPACLWLGARRDGHAAQRALALPALWLLLVTLMLSVGRGPLIAALVGCALWLAVVPLRLRAAALLLVAGAGAAVVTAWAFSNEALTTDGTPLDVRRDAGGDLGLLLLTLLVVMTLAGLWLSFALSRATLSRTQRTAVGAVLIGLVALAPLAAVGRLAVSDRGLTGSIADGWRKLTDPDAQQPGNDPSRLGSVGSVRAGYWDDALAIWRMDPPRTRWLGVGAEGYGTARRGLQEDRLRVAHAHGYVAQTLADLGLVGLAVSAALLVAWLVAAGRATALTPRRRWGRWLVAVARRRDWRQPLERRPAAPWTAERVGLVTLAAIAVTFGVHSAIDWTWFVPGTAVTGLLCAGWVAGRGPLTAPAGGAVAPARAAALWRTAPARLAVAAALLATAAAAAWVVWQPQRAAALEEEAHRALDAGRVTKARADARRAAEINPLSVSPLLTLAEVEEAAGEPERAIAAAMRAVRRAPASFQAWLRLAELQLAQGRTADALASASAAVFLNPWSPMTQGTLARAQQQAGAAPPAEGAPAPGAPDAADDGAAAGAPARPAAARRPRAGAVRRRRGAAAPPARS